MADVSPPSDGGDGDGGSGDGDGDGDGGTGSTGGTVKPKSSGGSGGSSVNVCIVGAPTLSQIIPTKNSVFRTLSEVSFETSKNTKDARILLFVNNESIPLNISKKLDGSFVVKGDVASLNLRGQVLIHLHVESSPKCSKDAIYVMTVDPNAVEKNTGPGDEASLGGSLFSDENDYVNELQRRGIVNAGDYVPARLLNRAEASKIISRSLGKGVEDIVVSTMPFPDVKLGEWYTEYIQLMKNLGIMKGYGDGMARPETNISHAEARAMLYRATGKKLVASPTTPCKDLASGAWYISYMKSSYAQGLLQASAEGNCRPDEYITRGEFAKIIVLFFGFNL